MKSLLLATCLLLCNTEVIHLTINVKDAPSAYGKVNDVTPLQNVINESSLPVITTTVVISAEATPTVQPPPAAPSEPEDDCDMTPDATPMAEMDATPTPSYIISVIMDDTQAMVSATETPTAEPLPNFPLVQDVSTVPDIQPTVTRKNQPMVEIDVSLFGVPTDIPSVDIQPVQSALRAILDNTSPPSSIANNAADFALPGDTPPGETLGIPSSDSMVTPVANVVTDYNNPLGIPLLPTATQMPTDYPTPAIPFTAAYDLQVAVVPTSISPIDDAVTPGPSGSKVCNMPPKVFAPYLSVSDTSKLNSVYLPSIKMLGIKYVTLAFLLQGADGMAAWDGTMPVNNSDILSFVRGLKATGGDVIASFGGLYQLT
jgi:hypothetical protein